MTDLSRVLSDNFFLSPLGDELAELGKNRKKALRNIWGELRKTLPEKRRWPDDRAGRLALIVRLLAANNRDLVTHVQLRHRHKRQPHAPGEVRKSGVGLASQCECHDR